MYLPQIRNLKKSLYSNAETLLNTSKLVKGGGGEREGRERFSKSHLGLLLQLQEVPPFGEIHGQEKKLCKTKSLCLEYNAEPWK